jgi:hypothetical protein
MQHHRYTVIERDTLWSIAERELGGGSQWSRIWRYNNRPEVREAYGFPDPDLIYVGQVLLLPPGRRQRAKEDSRPPGNLKPAHPRGNGRDRHPFVPPLPRPNPLRPTAPAAPQPPWQGQPLAPWPAGPSQSAPPLPSSPQPGPLALPPGIAPPHGDGPLIFLLISPALAFKYKVDMKFPPTDTGTAVIECSIEGDFTLMSQKQYPAFYFTQEGKFEFKLNEEANHALGVLIRETYVNYDPKKGIILRSMLLTQAKSSDPPIDPSAPVIGNAPSTGVGVEVEQGIPKLRWECNFKWIQGHLQGTFRGEDYDFLYYSAGVKFIIKITLKAPPPPSPPLPQANTGRAETSDERTWRYAVGTGLMIAAGVIVVAMIVQDVGTAGAGTADNPFFGGIAARLAISGASMLRAAPIAASVPATMMFERLPP